MRTYIYVLCVPVLIALLLGSIGHALTGMEPYNPKPFKDYPGNIVAGEPVTVLQHRWSYTSKGTGAKFYLVTEDCSDWSKPWPGKATNPECRLMRRRVSPASYLRFQDGEWIRWDANDLSRVSEVRQHRYKARVYSETGVYRLGLKVRQCLFMSECVEDTVKVSFKVWSDADRGDTLTFSGDPGEVVS